MITVTILSITSYVFVGLATVFLWSVIIIRVLYFLVKYELYVRSRYPENIAKLTFWSWNKFQTTSNLLRPLQSDDSHLLMIRKKLGNAAWLLFAASISIGLLVWFVLNS
jgi:hypothetical protein